MSCKNEGRSGAGAWTSITTFLPCCCWRCASMIPVGEIGVKGEVEVVTAGVAAMSELGLERALSVLLPLLLPVEALVRDGTPPEPLLFKLPRLVLPAGLLPIVLLNVVDVCESRRGGGPVP